MSANTVRLLEAAAEIAGGRKSLALRMGIDEAQLARFLADSPELPDSLLLRAVDIIFADRMRPSLAVQPVGREAT